MADVRYNFEAVSSTEGHIDVILDMPRRPDGEEVFNWLGMVAESASDLKDAIQTLDDDNDSFKVSVDIADTDWEDVMVNFDDSRLQAVLEFEIEEGKVSPSEIYGRAIERM